MQTIAIIAGLVCLMLLMVQRWFWLIVFGSGSMVSGFSAMVGALHFQVLNTLGFSFLMLICWAIAKVIAEGYPTSDEPPAQKAYFSSCEDNPDWSPP